MPIDDQLYSLRDGVKLTTVTQGSPDVVQGNNYALGLSFLSGGVWHAFNVIRLVCTAVGWLLTCLDLLYMTRLSWERFQGDNDNALETNALIPPSTTGLSVR
eukprot:TRINITY_DN1319_c0_g1_i2.p1 TRINITY_DN1319_c0_g1~~TRINITY_DN1319_c0_g1_i2.p1  ORF type:complete len:102 (-),score=17.45 TRINITY_DN1319_c0_g1_i2:42-347(-)